VNPQLAFLLVRARPKPAVRARFDSWFRNVHLRDVANIPGIGEIDAAWTAGGTRLGFYAFESGEAVQSALQSPQAAYARGTWEQWAEDLEEFSIEIFAPLFPLPIYQGQS
jgi:hypothetical protein